MPPCWSGSPHASAPTSNVRPLATPGTRPQGALALAKKLCGRLGVRHDVGAGEDARLLRGEPGPGPQMDRKQTGTTGQERDSGRRNGEAQRSRTGPNSERAGRKAPDG
ncbi:hypothetical protein HOK021_43410 [Streptomyces hygroscopicus]|nr:hypothetical protein HOK021_43410 [Streptomyces hygroscopicus]